MLVMVGGITTLGLMDCLVGCKAGLITYLGQITSSWVWHFWVEWWY